MKLLRVIANMQPSSGGPCQGLRNSIPVMEKMGVHNEVVSLDDPAAPYLGKDTFPIHALGVGKGPWYYNSKLVPWLLKNLERFDAIIVHGLWLYPSYAVLQAMELLRAQNVKRKQNKVKVPKFFVMPHGMLDPYFQRTPERRVKALRNIIYWKLIEGKVVNSADGLLFTCEEELQLAREPFQPYFPKQEINVGYGISQPPEFVPAMHKAFIQRCLKLGNQPYILYLGRIHEKKGIHSLIIAYAAVQQEMFSMKREMPKLVIAGPGIETSFGKKMQLLASKTSFLRNAIFFAGMLEGDAKWGAFYGCQAFVLPSHQENFGIAVVEAMACGKPVLITNQINIWREIRDEGGGLVSSDSLSDTIEMLKNWLAKSTDEKQHIGRNALLCYQKRFSIDEAVKHFMKVVTPHL